MSVVFEHRLDIEQCKLLLSELYTPSYLLREVNIALYAQKLSEKAHFLLMKKDDMTIGFIAYYLNRESSIIYITLITVHRDFRHQGVGRIMMQSLINEYKQEFNYIDLEVEKTNKFGQLFYKSEQFVLLEQRKEKFLLRRNL